MAANAHFYGDSPSQCLRLTGDWVAREAARLEAFVHNAPLTLSPETQSVVIDGRAIHTLDTLGAVLIHTLEENLVQKSFIPTLEGFSPRHTLLLHRIRQAPEQAPPRKEREGLEALVYDLGETIYTISHNVMEGVRLLGAVITGFARLLIGRVPMRLAAVTMQVERVALRGVPIVMLISFLVGAIIAQQSIFQLKPLGSVHFVADLLGVLVLRELSVLLTAIMIAGRSGSSFTAELGSMKMREEIDALQTMGRDPVEVLVLPRLLALLLALPLLTFLSSVAALAGGAMVAVVYGGMSLDIFLQRLHDIIGMNTFLVGMLKAPFMALVIGIIACTEGFAVRGSAESLGTHTTASVVKSIFVVIVVDGLFAMLFATINY